MKLKFTHKTWYFFLLCAAAASMLNGFAVLGGMDFSFLEMVAFCITGITILFLAAGAIRTSRKCMMPASSTA